MRLGTKVHENSKMADVGEENLKNGRELKISKKELAEARVPIHLRDYCAHLVVPLMDCQKKNYYLPWKCKHERHEWEVCQYTDFLMRKREFKKNSK